MAREPPAREAQGALLTAAALREGLGDDARALADLRAYLRHFGAGKINQRGERRLAEVHFAIGTILERREPPARVAAHYREYLGWRARSGGRALELAARVKLAAALWRQSCPVPGVDGLCVSAARAAAPACGTPVRPLTVHARRPALAREALAQIAAALGPSPWGAVAAPEPASGPVIGQARFILVDEELERFLAGPWPAGRAPADDGFFTRYQAASLGYQPWRTAGLARLGQLTSAIAERLRALPPGLEPGPRRDERCRAANAAARPFVAKAREVYETCLRVAGFDHWYDEWRAVCARGAGEGVLAEIAPQPGFISAVIAPAAAVLRDRSVDSSVTK